MSDSPPRKRLNPQRVTIHEEDSQERRGAFIEALHPYTREEAVAEAQRCIQCGKPWYMEACPISQDARSYLIEKRGRTS